MLLLALIIIDLHSGPGLETHGSRHLAFVRLGMHAKVKPAGLACAMASVGIARNRAGAQGDLRQRCFCE